jgi:hypothetical protein
MRLATWLAELLAAQGALAEVFGDVGTAHADEADVRDICDRLGEECRTRAEALRPLISRYGDAAPAASRPRPELSAESGSGPLGLLRDLTRLQLLVTEVELSWTLVGQAAQALRDGELAALAAEGASGSAAQASWVRTRLPQALVVAE